jgi:hypothetical protein
LANNQGKFWLIIGSLLETSMNQSIRSINVLNKLSQFFIAATLLLSTSMSFANEHKVGDVTIHYSVVNSTMLTPEVATQYRIKRSNQIGVLNISVHKRDKAVIANIFGNTKNIAGQLQELAFKEVKEDQAIYYLATFSFNHQQLQTFSMQVQPEKKGVLIPLQFKHTLFAD